MRGMLAVVVLTIVGCGDIVKKTDAGMAMEDSLVPPPDAAVCVAVAAECASEDVLRVCTTVGELPVDTACPAKCSTTGTAHCRVLTPHFKLAVTDLMPTLALVEVTMSATTTINVNDGSITNLRGAGIGLVDGIEFQVRDRVAIFRFQKLTITGGTPVQALTFTGDNAVALVAIDAIVADGTIFNVQGACAGRTAGPGGVTGATSGGGDGGGGASAGNAAAGMTGGKGGAAEELDGDFCGGGGGGGHFSNGGSGGRGGSSFAGGQGGLAETPVTFVGGGGGGGGGGLEFTTTGTVGGGGGGALHLAANRLVRITNGGIQAGGCGGGGGTDAGGSGGGGGGMMVIEADDIELMGSTFAANGGGGGGIARGTNGNFSAVAAQGGQGTTQFGAGGAGSTTNAAAPAGANAGTCGGGGGGGGGRIHLYSGDGLFSTGTVVFSPTMTTTGTSPVE